MIDIFKNLLEINFQLQLKNKLIFKYSPNILNLKFKFSCYLQKKIVKIKRITVKFD